MSRPHREIDLVFLLAGTAARRAELEDRTRATLARADFGVLERELVDRRLLPLIGSRAIDAAPDLVPAGFRAAVERARLEARARGLAIEAATRRIAATLETAGIRVLPLKGPLLAQEAHGDIGLRETADIDLLVAPGRLDEAAAVLRELGYADASGARRVDGLPDLHLELLHPTLAAVDLHWRMHWYERDFSAALLANAAPGADGILRPRPDDLVASLLLFYARDGLHGIRPAADLAAWWDRHGAPLAPRFLEGHAERYPAIAPALQTAAVAVEPLTGLRATDWLGAHRPSGRRVALATRLADWRQHGDRDQLRANMTLVGGLIGPPGSAAEFARREFTLSGARPGATAAHALKLSARYALALWSVRRGRHWAEPPLPV